MKKYLLSILVLPIFLFLSCSSDSDSPTNAIEDDTTDTSGSYNTNTQNISVDNAILISYTEDGVTVDNPYTSAVSITTDGQDVVINSTETTTALNYVISGQTTSGSLKIYSTYKYGLVLNGVSIINTVGPAINLQSSKKATLTLVANTNNRLIDGKSYTESSTEDMKGALFSEGQMIFEGTGNLLVTGRYKHAIVSDDYIQVNGGAITISGAVKDGIHVNDYFTMTGGTLNITSTGDGIECESGYVNVEGGQLTVASSGGDGVKTSYSGTDTTITKDIEISGGTTTINVTGAATKGIKSKGDFYMSSGKLIVTTTGDAYYDATEADTSSSAGIKVDGDMAVDGDAVITITSSGTGGKGINVTGILVFDGGTTTVTTSGNQYVYNSKIDTAAKAIKSTGKLYVNSGTVKIKTSTTEAEGLESKDNLTITGGVVEIEAYDDCINASNHIEITGGTVYCLSTTNDAIDSNGTMTISGGTVIAIGSSSPEAGFDCDDNTFKITGGTLIGFGGSTSTPTSSVSSQYSLVYGGSSYSLVNISSSTGDNILTFKLPKTFNSTTMLFSSPSLLANTTYNIYTGGSTSGGSESNGLYSGTTYSAGTLASTFTTTSIVTIVGTSGGGGGGRPR